jgi:hypothetical protein
MSQQRMQDIALEGKIPPVPCRKPSEFVGSADATLIVLPEVKRQVSGWRQINVAFADRELTVISATSRRQPRYKAHRAENLCLILGREEKTVAISVRPSFR